MRVLSFDLGILHMGVVVVEVEDEFFQKEGPMPMRVLVCRLIDITEYQHHHMDAKLCKRYHTREISDRLLHMLAEEESGWGEIDQVYIERQPLASTCSAIESLMFQYFRDKCIKVSPNAMHKFFHLSDDYEKRKVQTVALAEPMLSTFDDWKSNERKHDMADALVLASFRLIKLQRQKMKEKEAEVRQTRKVSQPVELDAMMDTFAYQPVSRIAPRDDYELL